MTREVTLCKQVEKFAEAQKSFHCRGTVNYGFFIAGKCFDLSSKRQTVGKVLNEESRVCVSIINGTILMFH